MFGRCLQEIDIWTHTQMADSWPRRSSPQIRELQKQVCKNISWLHNQYIQCGTYPGLNLCIILMEFPVIYLLRICMGCQCIPPASPFSLAAKAEQSSYTSPNFSISESLSPVHPSLFVNNPPRIQAHKHATWKWRHSRLCGWKSKILPGSLDFVFLTTFKYSI